MPAWVADHDVWEKAKKAIGPEEDSDSYWARVTSVYKKMGGAVRKSLESLYPDCEITPFESSPSFVIQKSQTEVSPDGTIIQHVGGVISDESHDSDNEVIIQKAIDSTYIDKGFGRIKYEHGEPNDLEEPKRFIGHIDKIIRKGKVTEFEGTIIARPGTEQYHLAKACIDDMNTIAEYNRKFPKSPKRVGWSIEGAIIKSRTGVKKASINHVVYTTRPVNTNSFATIRKSLSAGYGYDVADKTGGGAIRKESIETSPKYNTPTFSEGKSKMKFNDEQHAYRHFSKSMASEKAKEAAKQAMEAQAKEEGEENQGLDGLKTAIAGNLKKSLTAITGLLSRFATAKPYSEESERMVKALVPVKVGDNMEPNVEEFFKSLGATIVRIGEDQVEIARSNEGIINALDGMSQMVTSVLQKSQAIEKLNISLAAENERLTKSIGKFDRGIVAASGAENVIEGEAGTPLVKSLDTKLARKGMHYLHAQKKVTDDELLKFDAGHLSKSRAAEIITLYETKALALPAGYQPVAE